MKQLLLNKEKNNTERQKQIIKIGNNLYMLRVLYIIAKDSLYKDKNKKIIFYSKVKNVNKNNIFFPKPQNTDLIIDEYYKLIELILKSIILLKGVKYKISIYSSNFNLIKNNEQLLSYKGVVMYAKINEKIIYSKTINVKTNKENNSLNFDKSKKERKNKNNSLISFNKISYKSLLLFNKENNIKRTNNINIIDKTNIEYMNKKSNIKNDIDKQKLFKYTDINKAINNYNKNGNKKISNYINKSASEDKIKNEFSSKSSLYSIGNLTKSYSQINILQKNLTKYNDFPLKSKQLIDKSIIKNSKDISTSYNNNDIYKYKLNKSKSDIDIIKRRYNNYDNDDEGIYKENIRKKFYNDFIIKSIEKNKNKTIDNIMDNNISRNKIMFRKPSSFYKKQKKLFFHLNNIFLDKSTQIDIIHSNKKMNQSAIINNNYINDLNVIRTFLKSPAIKILKFKKDKENKNNNLEIINNLYKNCLYEINNIINNIDEYFPENIINYFIEHLDYSYRKKHSFININNCLKQFLLFSYLDKCLKINYSKILNNIFTKPKIDISSEELENLLKYFYNKIIETKKNNNFKLIEYIRGFKNIHNIKLSNDFFFVFILCSNAFDKLQREVGKKILLTLEIEEKIFFENYLDYYIYFKENKLATLDMKMNFLIKFLNIIQGGCTEGQNRAIVQKFNDDIQYLFRIDRRTKQKLMGKPYEIKMDYHMVAKINEIFNSLINFFKNL